MKRLAPILILPLCLTLTSCNLAGKLIQTPVRLIQAGGRTLTGSNDAAPPPEAQLKHNIALKATEPLR